MEVLLQLLEFLQHVVVDGGVAEDTGTRCQLLHQLAHCFVFASRRSTRNAQTPQDRGVDAVAVALDDLHTQCLPRVHNVATLIHLTASRISLDATIKKEPERTKKPEEQGTKKIEKCQKKKSRVSLNPSYRIPTKGRTAIPSDHSDMTALL